VYWSWYGGLPLPFLALLAGRGDTVAAGILALGSRIVGPLADLAAVGVIGYDVVWQQQALIGQTLPAALGLLLIAAHLARRQREGGPAARRSRSSAARAETPPIQ
jgi:hypothetical protein